MMPRHEIGSGMHWWDLQVGDPIVLRRGTAAYFFGRVTEVENLPPGQWRLRLKIENYWYQDVAIWNVHKYRGKWFEASPGTVIFSWWVGGVAGPARPWSNVAPSPAPSPTPSANQVSSSRRTSRVASMDARREQRKAYVAARSMLQKGRDELTLSLKLLDLDMNVEMEDFKRVRREVLFKWHPDRSSIFVQSGKGTMDYFRVQSERYIAALSFVENYIAKRFTRA